MTGHGSVGFSGNGSAKLKPAPRRILIFLARRMLRRNGVCCEVEVIHGTADHAIDQLVAVGGRQSDGQASAALLADQVGTVPLDRSALPPLGSEPHLLVHVQRRHLVRR